MRALITGARVDILKYILVNCLFWSEADEEEDEALNTFLCNRRLIVRPKKCSVCFCSAFVSRPIDKGPTRVRVYAECSYFGRRQMDRVIVCSNIRPTRARFMANAANASVAAAERAAALSAHAV
jgi:hypothetical protein